MDLLECKKFHAYTQSQQNLHRIVWIYNLQIEVQEHKSKHLERSFVPGLVISMDHINSSLKIQTVLAQ
jgi:hypothetical protein